MGLSTGRLMMIGLLVEGILFGLFTVLGVMSAYVHFRRWKRWKRVNGALMMTLGFMYIIAMGHLIVTAERIYNALEQFANIPGALMDSLLDLPNSLSVVQNSLYTVQTLLGDAFMVYRLYVVWSDNIFVYAPGVCGLIANIVLGIITTTEISRVSSTTRIFVLNRWVTSFFALTLIICFSSTSLIAWKIWQTQRSLPRNLRSRSLTAISCTLLESGAIYSATVIALIITYLAQCDVQYVLLYGVVQIIGIVFSLIIVLTTLGMSMGGDNVHVDEEYGGHQRGSPRFSPVSLRLEQRQGTTTNSYSGAASLVSAIVRLHSDVLKHETS